jgi:hypothetical protein
MRKRSSIKLRVGFRKPQVSMDHRVKPGGDEEKAWLFDIENQNARVHTRRSAAIRCRASCRDRAKLVANG